MFIVAILWLVACVVEYFQLLKWSKLISIDRQIEKILSLGDYQPVTYTMKNDTTQDLYCEIIDEMPYQLQIRDAIWKGIVVKNSTEIRQLPIRPSTRGEYIFDGVHLFFHRKVMPMFIWQVTNQESTVCKVYPSVIQMQKIEFLITNKTAHHTGIRKIRSIGDDDEFEHLRNYIPGNNIKHINWKASSRRNELVVNQYQDNRSQNIYLLIDKGRCMEMPFDNMSLLDYAVNTSLIFAKVILRKYDKPGVITFNNKVDQILQPHSSMAQLGRISEMLYNQKTDFLESNFDVLYMQIRQNINKRSILFMFTNFENLAEVERNLPYLKLIAKSHLLVIISFVNSDLEEMLVQDVNTISRAFENVIAESLLVEKEQMLKILNQEGILTILTTPNTLSIDTINKYLEIKAKRMK